MSAMGQSYQSDPLFRCFTLHVMKAMNWLGLVITSSKSIPKSRQNGHKVFMTTKIENITSRLGRPVTLVGLMGSGKSLLGKQLAKQLGLPFTDSDKAIEEAAGLTIADIFDIAGDTKFRAMESRIIAELLASEAMILATGGGAICNAKTADLLLSKSVVIWLQASPETLFSRIGTTSTRPLLSGADPLAKLQHLDQVRRSHYEKAHIHVNTDGMSSERALAALIDALDSFLPVK